MINFIHRVLVGLTFLGIGTAVAIGLMYVVFQLFFSDHPVITRLLIGAAALYMFLVGYFSEKEVRDSDEINTQ
ncbi:hypothetical protein [Paenibacillus sp. PDC88]|uniref:hypothetical protein n=1 Tax=Paenibacillus sp. PDC88 TaxID=1884375 RepID=UPI00089D9B17|nr:hypothetical protein [Paenibacillus sp. PDC88]SDW23807.1 hypothetical protein SAMN05518848_101751 [Paenibacillus sp. PDC88]